MEDSYFFECINASDRLADITRKNYCSNVQRVQALMKRKTPNALHGRNSKRIQDAKTKPINYRKSNSEDESNEEVDNEYEASEDEEI